MRPAKHFKTILCQTFGLWALSLLWPESVKLPFHEHNPVNRLKVTHSQKLCHAFIVTWWLMVSPEVATEKLALACICLSLFSPLAFLSVWSHLPFPFVSSPSLFGVDTLLFVKVEDPWTLLVSLLFTRFPVCLKSSTFVPSPSLFGFDTLLFVKVEDPWTLLVPLFSTHFPVFLKSSAFSFVCLSVLPWCPLLPCLFVEIQEFLSSVHTTHILKNLIDLPQPWSKQIINSFNEKSIRSSTAGTNRQ